jgi:HEPN domain-containing protein
MKDNLTGWVLYANRDYDAFLVLSEKHQAMLEICTLHAQQAVEKWVKGLLVLSEINPPKIHDIITLIEKIESRYPELKDREWRECAVVLIGFAV